MAKNPPFNLQGPPEIDTSLFGWISNIHSVLQFPLTALSVAGLLVLGVFVGSAPRKSLELVDNTFGSVLFFVLPMIITNLLDWPTGLLAATVSLIVFARLQKEDYSEGFSNSLDNTNEQVTTVISNPNRWFIEKVLGERPLAISSDRVITSAVQANDSGKSTSPQNSTSLSSFVSQFSSSSSNK
jgi:hypothetical protein